MKTYSISIYLPWIKKLKHLGFEIDVMAALGGEPFLHPCLDKFLSLVKPHANRLETMSNLYWLRGEQDIESKQKVLTQLDRLVVTYYKPYCERVGGVEQIKRLVQLIGEKHPHLQVHETRGGMVETFAAVEFSADSKPIKGEKCSFRNCLNLLKDGRLMRCCFVRRVLAGDTRAGGARDLTFNLGGDVDRDKLEQWLTEFPDICSYCSIAQDGYAKQQEWRQVR